MTDLLISFPFKHLLYPLTCPHHSLRSSLLYGQQYVLVSIYFAWGKPVIPYETSSGM
jgi:hypothetical protein